MSYLLFGFVLMLIIGFVDSALGQEMAKDQELLPVTVCSNTFLAEADSYYKERSLRQTGKTAYTRYKEILEKCPNSPERHETETKTRVLEEESAEHLFMISMYYWKTYLQTGHGGRGASLLLKEIVEKMPNYSRISEAKMWLDQISRILAAEENI